MNLKEAFRFQNKLKELAGEAEDILSRESNITRVVSTQLRKKVYEGAENETTVQVPDTEFADNITDIARFVMNIIAEREKLNRAIREAKSRLPIDMDGEVSLNGMRRDLSLVFRKMAEVRNSEKLIPGSGTGYRFNQEGNQVSFRCDLKRVTTINFDRNVIRNFAAELSRKSDEISMEIDRRTVNTEVDYEPPFDVNDSFAEIFARFIGSEAY